MEVDLPPQLESDPEHFGQVAERRVEALVSELEGYRESGEHMKETVTREAAAEVRGRVRVGKVAVVTSIQKFLEMKVQDSLEKRK